MPSTSVSSDLSLRANRRVIDTITSRVIDTLAGRVVDTRTDRVMDTRTDRVIDTRNGRVMDTPTSGGDGAHGGGAQVLCDEPSARSALLRQILERLRGSAMAIWMDPGLPSSDLETTLAEAASRCVQFGGRLRPVILVDNAERLSGSALALLNGIAAGRVLGLGETRIILAGSHALPRLLDTAGVPALRDHVGKTVELGLMEPSAATLPRSLAVLAFSMAVVLLPMPAGRPYQPQPPPNSAPAEAASVRPALPALPEADQVLPDAGLEAALVPPAPLPPPEPVEPAPEAPQIAVMPPIEPRPADGSAPAVPGLLLVARSGDTLEHLYRMVYHGVRPPPYQDVSRANPLPVRPGAVLVFPTPPDGWTRP